eukprot:TRINITY_DN10422_c0_g1_i1.p1 TRINITY_DN10422_c0_g1~~TRINITY_DN10422_c0_g1_i1.p1  ORF type:complete len:179 (-),score=35.26 TRINITY_DN10422_c0_g1_i1:73-609(-)
MTTEPYKHAWIWADVCKKEMATWAKNNMANGSGGNAGSTGSTFYRVPLAGEPVTLMGMRNRPELNGVDGEVVSSKQDEFGRITVRVFDEVEGERKMKVQPFRLIPSSSAPFVTDTSSNAASSVRSVLSVPGSRLSAGGRSLGSAISLSAKSALSNQGLGVRKSTPMSQLSKVGSAPAL